MIIRRGVALIPPLCLRVNSKKIAAFGTILMSFFYLVLSGFGIPGQRSFIMISLVMGAIFIDRSALSMRTVAFAAFAILLITPEALLTPSFLLSFSAVVCLIAGYESLQNPLTQWIIGGGALRKFLLYVGGLAFTSFLATLATLPFTIYFFNRFSLHATEANLVAVPLTSLVIMPSALVTCLLAPLGLEKEVRYVFETSLQYLVEIANTVSSWQGTNILVPYPPFFAFLLLVFGGLWLCIWQQKWRRWGLVPLSLGAFFSFVQDYPHILIDGQGKIVAHYKDKNLYLTSLRRGKFTAEAWQKSLAAKEKLILPCENNVCKTHLGTVPILIATAEESPPCVKGALLIHLEPNEKNCSQALLILDWYDIWREGAHALWISSQGIKVETVRKHQGNRPWTKQAIHRKDRPFLGKQDCL
jgi:competence protein ComEC